MLISGCQSYESAKGPHTTAHQFQRAVISGFSEEMTATARPALACIQLNDEGQMCSFLKASPHGVSELKLRRGTSPAAPSTLKIDLTLNIKADVGQVWELLFST